MAPQEFRTLFGAFVLLLVVCMGGLIATTTTPSPPIPQSVVDSFENPRPVGPYFHALLEMYD